MSEMTKYRHLILKYCQAESENFHIPITVLDIASQGDPVCPWAWSLDLPEKEFLKYNAGNPPPHPIQLRGDARRLPISDNSVDTVVSSHLLEDFNDWEPLLKEWTRVVKPGGHLVILIPDRERFRAAVAAGQPDNLNHQHEGRVGELSTYAEALGLEVIEDRFTDLHPGDYTILFVGKRNENSRPNLY